MSTCLFSIDYVTDKDAGETDNDIGANESGLCAEVEGHPDVLHARLQNDPQGLADRHCSRTCVPASTRLWSCRRMGRPALSRSCLKDISPKSWGVCFPARANTPSLHPPKKFREFTSS